MVATCDRQRRNAPAIDAKKAKPAQRTRSARALAADQLRAAQLAKLKIEYIPCRSFSRAKAAAEIMSPLDLAPLESPAPTVRIPAGLTPYLRSLYETRLISGDEEVYYFRKMNYLKYHALKLRKQLDFECPQVGLMDQIEASLADADAVKNILIRANLRLVVSIAKKFLDANSDLQELISDGNISLMRAIEKFDFARGYKFSTYASYAIRRNFFRSVINGRRDRSRYLTGDDELLKVSADDSSAQQISESQLARLQTTMGQLVNNLNPREQLIISLRFGMGQAGEEQTLAQIAKALGVCKERVRQLQTRALEKLHKLAGERMSELAELL